VLLHRYLCCEEVIGSGGEVNAMKSEFVGEGLPAVDFAADEKGGDQGGRHASGWSKAKCRQKDRDARWMLDRGRSRRKPEPAPPAPGRDRRADVRLQVAFNTDRRHGLIRGWTVTDAGAHDSG
jgi:IS5 family transposase